MAGGSDGRNTDQSHTGDQGQPSGGDSSELTTQQLNVVGPRQDSSALTTQHLNVVPPPTPGQQPPGGGYQTPPGQPASFAPTFGPSQPAASAPTFGPAQPSSFGPAQPASFGPGQPPPPTTSPTSFKGPKLPQDRRRLLIIGLVVVVVLGGGGLTWALWPGASKKPVAASPRHVVPGTLQASILTPDEVSREVGTTVISGSAVNRPPPALTANPDSCAVAVGPATVSGYTKGWTVFYSSTYQDAAGAGDYTVTQTIGVYGDAGQSASVFQNLGKGIGACPSATRTDQNKNSVKWNYTVDSNTPAQLVWTASQESGRGWACYRQARLKGKAVVEVAVCEGGDGKAAAAQVADRFEAKVNG